MVKFVQKSDTISGETCDQYDTYIYRIAQNSGGVKLWRISDFKVLARKTLANAQHLYYWEEKNFGKSEGKLSFAKQKSIY